MATSIIKRTYNLHRLSPLLLRPVRKSNVTITHGHPKFHLCSNYSSSPIDKNLQKLTRDQVDVSLMLAKHVFSSKGESQNIVLSPLSINVFLGLIAVGTKGPARDEILCFLKSKSIEDFNAFYSRIVSAVFADSSHIGGPHLSVANGLWIDQTLSLKPSYKHVVDNVYHATSESVDFQKAEKVAEQVNLWANKETRGLIKHILSPCDLDEETRLILANALYFKGVWTKQFDAKMTKNKKFHLLNGSSVQVPFMSNDKRQCVEAFNGFKVLQLPYEQGKDKSRNFSMYLFLPDAMDGLPSLMDKVCSESGFLNRHLPCDLDRVVGKFRIPKFKISFGFNVSNVLKELGVMSPFKRTEMVDSLEGLDDDFYVSKIFHKAFIEVNETSTEAAAVTCARAGCGSSACFHKALDFVADHPFLFVIREDLSGVILFIGTVLNSCSD